MAPHLNPGEDDRESYVGTFGADGCCDFLVGPADLIWDSTQVVTWGKA